MAGVVAAAVACAMLLAQSPQLISFAPTVNESLEAQVAPVPNLRPIYANQASVGEIAGRAQLVKAVIPAPEAPKRVKRAVVRPRPQLPDTLIAPEPRQLMVLTEWRDVEGTPQVVIAVDRKTRSQYAAVQMAGGWVLFQI